MKSFYEKKTISDSVLDVDDKSRRVKVAISEVESLDLDNDIIDQSAYNKTIPERGPKGANLIWHLTDHTANLKSAVAKFKDLYVEGTKVLGVTDIPNTTWGNDVLEFYKGGHINQHSIGFKTIKQEVINKGKDDEHNRIKEVFLYEGSAVLWGANPNTDTVSVGKSLTKEEAESQFVKFTTELNILMKSLKDGRFTDETFELMEIRINQVQENIKQLILNINSTQPVQSTVEPVKNDELLRELKSINQFFN